MRLLLDSGWVRITNETDENNERIIPLYARNVRTQGGMIIGRVVHRDVSKFEAEKFKGGQFVLLGSYPSIEEARKAIEAD